MTEQQLWVPGSSGVPLRRGLHAGNYYTAPFIAGQGVGDFNSAAGRMEALLFPIEIAQALDRIGLWLNAPYGAGSLLRLGIYKARAGTYPGALVFDAGNVDMTVAAGWQELVLSDGAGGPLILQPDLYMLTATGQAGWTVGTGSVIRCQQGQQLGLSAADNSNGSQASIGSAAGVPSGPLPNPGPDLLAGAALNMPTLKVRAA